MELFELGAVTEDRTLTELGRRLSKLPVDPRIGRIILAGHDENCLREILIIGSILEIQDPRERPVDKQQQADQAHAPFQDPDSDFLSYLKLWDFYDERDRELSRSKLRNATEPEVIADLQFEFEVAHWLLQEPRFEVEYETFDARQGGPDYTVAYRVNTRFNVEVRRIRTLETGEERVRKLVEVVTNKAKQMPPNAINLLVMV